MIFLTWVSMRNWIISLRKVSLQLFPVKLGRFMGTVSLQTTAKLYPIFGRTNHIPKGQSLVTRMNVLTRTVRWLKPRDKERLDPRRKNRLPCWSGSFAPVASLVTLCLILSVAAVRRFMPLRSSVASGWELVSLLCHRPNKSRLAETYPARVIFLQPTDPEPALNPAHTIHPILVRVIGVPVTPADAAKLAEDDKFHFQCWALGLVTARPIDPKKGADHGIDGKIPFRTIPKPPSRSKSSSRSKAARRA